MTLADAIRLGGTLSRKQITYSLADKAGGTCALGGAMRAVGLNSDSFCVPEFWGMFPAMYIKASCPVCRQYGPYAGALIAHLNDDHEWSRDQIADFVESLAPPAPVGPAIEAAAVAAREVPA